MENATLASTNSPYYQKDYGPTIGLHVYLMGAIWSPLANIAILIMICTYRKYAVWVHGLFFTFATIITLACSIPIIIKAGISCQSVKNMFATVSLFLITFNTLLGMMVKMLNICGARSSTILKVKKIHKMSGYIVVMCCKLTTFIKSDIRLVWILIDATFILIYVLCKIMFPRL